MKKVFLKSMLLLCALIVGSSSVWATDIESNFTNKDLAVGTGELEWTASASANSFESSSPSRGVQFGAAIGAFTLTSNTSLSNISSVSLIVSTNGTASSNKISVKVGGTTDFTTDGSTKQYSMPKDNNYTVTFSGTATTGTVVISLNDASKSIYIKKITVSYSTGGGPTTYTVTYNGNGKTSGDVPTDNTAYTSGATVTVLGNTGNLAKTNYSFSGWNTKADGTGTNYSAGGTFAITKNTTLYAKWDFVVTDGVFNFVAAASADEDYGSGVETTSTSTYYETADKTWTAGNVTMVTSKVSGNGYRWWSDGTLRFYNKSTATISVPDGYVITKITGASFNSSSPSGLDGTKWIGASNEVVLTATASKTISALTVSYTTANQTITPAYAKTTYVTPYNMNFSGIAGLTAYRASAAANGSVTLTAVGAVPAGTPLLLIGTAGTNYSVPVIASADAIGTNLLEAGDGETEFDGSTYDYLLYSDGLFYQIGEGTIAKNKAYLHCTENPNPTLAPGLRVVVEENNATNISAIDENDNVIKFFENGQLLIKRDGVVYDAIGRVVR